MARGIDTKCIHLEEEEEIEMCKAIEDLIAESEARGRAEGETRGEAKGMIEICLDMSFSKEDILKKLQEKLNISLQQAVTADLDLRWLSGNNTILHYKRQHKVEHPCEKSVNQY
jgi:hypothetical protein